MPRSLRIDYDNAWHHVVNRGAARAKVFLDDWDNRCFLESISEAASLTHMEIHAYCIMGNHYHLLVRSRNGRLSDFMRQTSGRFVKLRNLRRGQDGPLFKGRFWSAILESDAHLVQASRYVHLNPVNADLVKSPTDWPWSSAAAYLGLHQPPDWLTISEILSMFGPADERRKYSEYLAEGVDAETIRRYAEIAEP